MDTAEKIKAWLESFDSTIDAIAVDPAAVNRDGFLRRAFELSFPPNELPDEISIKNEGKAADLEEIAKAHHPYYLSSTKETSKTNPKTGAVKTTSVLTLRLKNLSGVAQALRQHGLIRRGAEVVSRAVPLAGSGRGRGQYGKIVSLLLKTRRFQEAELARLEALENESKKRGDMQMAKHYQEERKRVAHEIESFGADL